MGKAKASSRLLFVGRSIAKSELGFQYRPCIYDSLEELLGAAFMQRIEGSIACAAMVRLVSSF